MRIVYTIALVLLAFKIVLANPPRIVVTSPEIAEIVCALDAGEFIVGLTQECDYPTYLEEVEKVGSFGNVSFEAIISIQPTHVFISGLEQAHLKSKLQKISLPVYEFYPQSVASFLSTIAQLGELLNKESRARVVQDSLRNELAQLARSQPANSPRVYIEIYQNPIMSVSRDSFVGELVHLAGGENIFDSLPREYSRISPERVVEADPEVIIITYPGGSKEQMKNRRGWEVISAVRHERIYTVNDIDADIILRASPRLIDGIKALRELIYE
jgi:iron complex transport system substrate-binding protein